MKNVKMLGLPFVAAAVLAAFGGAGTASAEGVLCSTTQSPCPSGQRWTVNSYVQMISEESIKLATTGGITAATCTAASIRGTLTSNLITATILNEEITWGAVGTPCTKAATTVALGSLAVERIAGTSNGTVKADTEIKVTITGLFEGETCNYGAKAGTSLGTITEGKPATFDVNAVLVKLAGHSCFFGPETTKWTGAYIISFPTGTTLSVSSS